MNIAFLNIFFHGTETMEKLRYVNLLDTSIFSSLHMSVPQGRSTVHLIVKSDRDATTKIC
jgi:hypothetical protein